MSDAILFFDECESLFAQRSTGGSSELTELLTEIERYEEILESEREREEWEGRMS